MEFYLVVDVGATNTRVGIASSEGLIDKRVFPTPRSGGELAVAEAIRDQVLKHYASYLDRVVAVGVATIGPLDIKRGRVVNPANTPLKSFELLRPLREYFGKPVYVVNDAVAGAYGELYYGAGRGYENLVYITISTGVGGGVVVDGHLLIGKQGNAHEIGHLVVKYDSRVKCGCGGFGHWEAYAGGANAPQLARALALEERYETPAWKLAVSGELNAPTLYHYYRLGDGFAKRVVSEIVEASVAGLASVINAYDPEVVSIGGAVFLNNTDILFKPLVEGVEKHLMTGKPVITPTPLGGDAPLYGALSVAVKPPEQLLKLQEQ